MDQRIKNLCSHLQSKSTAIKFLHTLDESYHALIASQQIQPQDISVEIDLAFRQVLDEYLFESTSVTNESNESQKSLLHSTSNITHLISLSIELGSLLPEFSNNKSFDGMSYFIHLQKVVFTLLDDLISTSTIHKIEASWNDIETIVYKLHKTSFFSKGQLSILKVCNLVLKRCSKSRNTVFCGRVLVLLSGIFPITDRSALNIGGEVNASNISTFEDETEFNEKQTLYSHIEVVPTSTTDNTTLPMQTNEEGEESDMINENSPPYSLYKTFWGLQSYLCSPLPKPDATSGLLPIDVDVLKTFICEVNIILSAFQQVSVSKVDDSTTSTDATATYSGTKYLTSSQLFPLQLKDPILRIQVCYQIQAFITYLRVKTFEIKSTSTTTVSLTPKDVAYVIKGLDDIEKQIEHILTKIGTHGKDISVLLTSFMERESFWIKWKSIKPIPCPEFIRQSSAAASTSVSLHDSQHYNPPLKKQKVLISEQSKTFQVDCSQEAIEAVSKKLIEDVPTFEAHLEAFKDAEDPDAGIDDEYHPKHDHVYCWRAIRLLAEKDITALEHLGSGDIAKCLRIVAGLPEPTVHVSSQVVESEVEKEGDTDKIVTGDKGEEKMQVDVEGEGEEKGEGASDSRD